LGITGSKAVRRGLVASLNAAYTVPEIKSILTRTELKGWQVNKSPLGLIVSGQKTQALLSPSVAG
jgi:hypothetical protein